MDSVVEVTEVRVQASLHFVSLDFETKRGPLFQALSSGASVCMYSVCVHFLFQQSRLFFRGEGQGWSLQGDGASKGQVTTLQKLSLH